MSEVISSVSVGSVKQDTREGRTTPGPATRLPHLTRTSTARRSTPVARMEYCGEPWGRTPVRVSGIFGRGPKEALDPAAPRHRTGTGHKR